MAITFINPPAQNTPVLTSELYALKATTDVPKVPVEIIRDPAGDSDCFFETILYPSADGIVEFSDIGSLIEEHFRDKLIIWDTIEIRFDREPVSFTALYCDYMLDVDFDYTACFLSAAGSSFVHRNSAISLSHWNLGLSDYLLRIVGHDDSGNIASVTRTVSRQKTSFDVSFSVNEIIDLALAPADGGDRLATVSYFSISYASIQKVFWLVDHPFFLTFGFRNMFNAFEYVDVVGILSRKTTVDSDTAICAGRTRQYNHTVARQYEIQTAPLTDEQVKEIEQLIASRNIILCAGDYDYKVIITDHTVEIDNDDESLSSIKFSFRFVDGRPRLISSEMGALMPSHSHIFTHEFTQEFA